MKPLSILCTVILIGALIGSTLTLAESANAQTLASPEYTLEQVGDAVLVTIKNQAFTWYTDKGSLVDLVFFVSYYEGEGNNGSRWVEPNKGLEYTTIKISSSYEFKIRAGNLLVSVQPVVAKVRSTEVYYQDSIKRLMMGLPLSEIVNEYTTISSGINITKSITILNDATPTYTEPTHTNTPTSTPKPSSTPPVYSSDSNQQDNSAQQDNSFFNDALNISWDFDWERAVLAVMAVVIAVLSLGMIGLWRRTSKLMKTNQQLG